MSTKELSLRSHYENFIFNLLQWGDESEEVTKG